MIIFNTYVFWSFAPHDVAVILRLIGQSPIEVSATGGSYLTKGLADVTVSNMRFSDDTRAHIFVSWLHPFKEQRLVVVGDKKMAIFNDVATFGEKLLLYPQTVEFEGKIPVLKKEDFETKVLFTEVVGLISSSPRGIALKDPPSTLFHWGGGKSTQQLR